jgi:serine/threonine protein phosphatase PrpC
MLKSSLYTAVNMHGSAEVLDCGAGHVVLFSSRAPNKSTDNEDSCGVFHINQDSCVLVVADGMGGLPRGQDASAIVVQTIEKALHQHEAAQSGYREPILTAIEQANQQICELAAGSTAAIVEIGAGEARSYHVGDSKILVVGQKGKLKLETISHSPTEYAVEAGYINDREAMTHEDRPFVTNMLGAADMRIEMGSPVKLSRFDTLLIASDGLFDNMHPQEITDIVRKGPLQSALHSLVEICRQRMSRPQADTPSAPDDLTIILYRRQK